MVFQIPTTSRSGEERVQGLVADTQDISLKMQQEDVGNEKEKHLHLHQTLGNEPKHVAEYRTVELNRAYMFKNQIEARNEMSRSLIQKDQ